PRGGRKIREGSRRTSRTSLLMGSLEDMSEGGTSGPGRQPAAVVLVYCPPREPVREPVQGAFQSAANRCCSPRQFCRARGHATPAGAETPPPSELNAPGAQPGRRPPTKKPLTNSTRGTSPWGNSKRPPW